MLNNEIKKKWLKTFVFSNFMVVTGFFIYGIYAMERIVHDPKVQESILLDRLKTYELVGLHPSLAFAPVYHGITARINVANRKAFEQRKLYL